MSRNYDNDYEPNLKHVDIVSDDENDEELTEDEVRKDNNEDIERMYHLMLTLKEYVDSQGLSLCEYLNFDLFSEFLEVI